MEDWNGFQFRTATDEDAEEIAELLRTSYYPDEPMTKLIGFTDQYGKDYEQIWRTFFKDQLSFVAIDKDSGEIAGVRLLSHRRKGTDLKKFVFKAPQMALVVECLKCLDGDLDIFKKYEVDKYVELFMTCVKKKFRRCGLAKQMYIRTLQIIREKGYTVASANFSSPFARKAAIDSGFEQLAIIQFINVKDSNGQPLLPHSAEQDMFSRAVCIL